MDIYTSEKATARIWICEEKRARWKELKCPRWRILERWAHPPAPAIPSTPPPPAATPPARSFQAEDSLGTKDPATGMILIEYDYLPSSSGLPGPPLAREALRLRVRRAANRARGNFLPHQTDGWERDPSETELSDLIYIPEESSVEFRVRVKTGNISRSRIQVSGAFLRGVIVLGLFRQNKYNIAKYS